MFACHLGLCSRALSMVFNYATTIKTGKGIVFFLYHLCPQVCFEARHTGRWQREGESCKRKSEERDRHGEQLEWELLRCSPTGYSLWFKEKSWVFKAQLRCQLNYIIKKHNFRIMIFGSDGKIIANQLTF